MNNYEIIQIQKFPQFLIYILDYVSFLTRKYPGT